MSLAEPDPVTLQVFLASRDAPCPNCGYNLRGLLAEACPECNAVLELRVGLVEPRLGAFLCGAIGLGAGLGFSGLLLAYFVWMNVFGWRGGGPSWKDCIPLMVGVVVESVLMERWLRTRARQRAMNPATHWALAVAWWVLTLGCAIWFFGAVR